MKNNKQIIWISAIISLLSLVISISNWNVSIFDFKDSDYWSNLFLGIFTSGLMTCIVSLINYKNETRKYINEFLWNGIIPYNHLMDELFAYVKDFIFLEELIFEKYSISKDTSEWKMYHKMYVENNKILKPKIIGLKDEIIHITNVHGDWLSYMSSLFHKIDSKNLYFMKSKEFSKCYKVYHIFENINWTLTEAREYINNIELIEDIDEKLCSYLIVLRWLSNTLAYEYDRGIKDIPEDEVEEENEKEIISAKKDFTESINDIIKLI